jgi:hypothetical protein
VRFGALRSHMGRRRIGSSLPAAPVRSIHNRHIGQGRTAPFED